MVNCINGIPDEIERMTWHVFRFAVTAHVLLRAIRKILSDILCGKRSTVAHHERNERKITNIYFFLTRIETAVSLLRSVHQSFSPTKMHRSQWIRNGNVEKRNEKSKIRTTQQSSRHSFVELDFFHFLSTAHFPVAPHSAVCFIFR